MTWKRNVVASVVAGVALTASLPTAALADKAYPTQQYPVTAVAGAPLDRGTVINIHANGPVIYGQERYTLVGAEPSKTYRVHLMLFADPLVLDSDTCSMPALPPLDTGDLRTNRVGNGNAKATFTVEEIPPLAAETRLTGRWTFSDAEGVVYSTGCHVIVLDVPPSP